jgi:hypothetical protein
MKGPVTLNRGVTWTVWVFASLILVGTVVGIAQGLADGQFVGTTLDQAGALAWNLLPLSFAATAAVIVSRQPRNLVGWLLMVPALAAPGDTIFAPVLDALTRRPDVLSGWQVAALFWSNWSWILLIFPVFHLLWVFPTGRLLSRRWRLVVALEVTMATVLLAASLFGSSIGPVDSWQMANPIGFIPIGAFDFIYGNDNFVWTIGLLVLTVAGVAAIALRYRNSGTVERGQIKWLLYAVAVFGLVYAAAASFTSFADGGIFDLLLATTLMSIPVSIGIAVLRYRLFDIDLIIRRTLVYTVLTGTLIGIYVGSVVILQNLIGGAIGEQSPLTVAASTLLIASLFNPVRHRLQRVVDRNLFRSKYNTQKVVEAFVATTRDQADVDQLAADLLQLVEDTLQPSVQGVWVKGAAQRI